MRQKLAICIAGALITLAGGAVLASPANATGTMIPCGQAQQNYAQGYADGSCQTDGHQGGNVTSCSMGGDGFTFTFTCY